MEQTPLVSVVVPSYEQGKFLSTTLESLVSQTYPRIEVIVQDNRSRDQSAAILARFRDRLSQVVVEADEGQSDALRRGFRRATGSILTWLNADDLLMPDAVEEAVRAFTEDGELGVVYGDCAHISGSGQFLRYFYEIQPYSETLLRNAIDFITQPGTFFRRGAYDKIGGIDPDLHYAMDWDLWCRFASAGLGFRKLERVVSAARFYPETKTASGGFRRALEILKVNARHKTSLVPWGGLSHLYGDLLRPRLRAVEPVARWIYRRMGPGETLALSEVHGLARGNIVVGSRFFVRFPVFRKIAGATMRLLCDDEPTLRAQSAIFVAGTSFRMEGRMDGTSVDWRFPEPLAANAISIECELDPERARDKRLHLAEIVLDWSDAE